MKTIKWLLTLGIVLGSMASCSKSKERDEYLQYQIDALANQVHRLHLEILEMGKRTDSLVLRMDSTDAAIGELKATIGVMQAQIATVTAQLDLLRTELSAVKVDLAKVLADLNLITANMVTLQNNYLQIVIWIQNHHGNNSNNSGHVPAPILNDIKL